MKYTVNDHSQWWEYVTYWLEDRLAWRFLLSCTGERERNRESKWTLVWCQISKNKRLNCVDPPAMTGGKFQHTHSDPTGLRRRSSSRTCWETVGKQKKRLSVSSSWCASCLMLCQLSWPFRTLRTVQDLLGLILSQDISGQCTSIK